MKSLVLIFSLLFSQNIFSANKDINHPDYAKSGWELCDYLDLEHGFNPMTLFCAIKSDSKRPFCTELEASFCHKVISEGKIEIGLCFELIIGNQDKSDNQLNYCSQLKTQQQIYNCMTN
ncbi:MAG: hypothetical protein VX642_00610 [Bdellovibrionota bacterium]|nr:hypothetical protein [Bdellovibrionota bacterium]